MQLAESLLINLSYMSVIICFSVLFHKATDVYVARLHTSTDLRNSRLRPLDPPLIRRPAH